MRRTAADVEWLREKIAAGWTSARVGASLGISGRAVRRLAKRHGLSFRHRHRTVEDGLRVRWIAMLPAMKEALRRNIETTSG
jgi:hypothetical protein